jgi:hypothetical protein
MGTDQDHAILMASIFRTSKYEDSDEFKVWMKQMKASRKSKRLEIQRKLFTEKVKVAGLDSSSSEEEKEGEGGNLLGAAGGLAGTL